MQSSLKWADLEYAKSRKTTTKTQKTRKNLRKTQSFPQVFFAQQRENHAKITQTLPSLCERVDHQMGGVFLMLLIVEAGFGVVQKSAFKP